MEILPLKESLLESYDPEGAEAAEIACLLGERIRSYTGGNASLKDVTATGILSSIELCLKVGRRLRRGVEENPVATPGTKLREDYAAGLEQVKKCFADTKKLYLEIVSVKLPVPLDAYLDTLDIAMPDFFNAYDAEYFAHETPCGIDYPLAFNDISLQGVFYIRRYLETLKLETEFCRCFPEGQILDFLSCFQKKHGWEALDAPLNLLGVLFDQQILSLLCGHGCPCLLIEPSRISALNKDLSGKAQEDLRRMISKAADEMMRSLGLRNPRLRHYLQRYGAQLNIRFQEAAKQGDLSLLAVTRPGGTAPAMVAFVDGDSLSRKDFIRLTERIGACGSTAERTALITGSLHALSDYIDLFSAGYLYQDEYRDVFQALGPMELAALGKGIFAEALREGPLCRRPSRRAEMAANASEDWHIQYLDYLFGLDERKRKEIEGIMACLR
jgi:hypothetical protein